MLNGANQRRLRKKRDGYGGFLRHRACLWHGMARGIVVEVEPTWGKSQNGEIDRILLLQYQSGASKVVRLPNQSGDAVVFDLWTEPLSLIYG